MKDDVKQVRIKRLEEDIKKFKRSNFWLKIALSAMLFVYYVWIF